MVEPFKRWKQLANKKYPSATLDEVTLKLQELIKEYNDLERDFKNHMSQYHVRTWDPEGQDN